MGDRAEGVADTEARTHDEFPTQRIDATPDNLRAIASPGSVPRRDSMPESA
jgi:hypothetical protein